MQPGIMHTPWPAAVKSYPGAPHLVQDVTGLVIFFTRLIRGFYLIARFDGWL
jgi:hypothetical protein